MLLTDLVAPNAIIPALKVNGKKQVLQELAAQGGGALRPERARDLRDLCSSARSSARPASATASPFRTASCRSSTSCSGLFARLERPVDFEALDGQPVDLVFLLLAPETAGADHLKALARVARLLRDPDVARKLREFARRRGALRRAGDAVGKRGVNHTNGFDV